MQDTPDSCERYTGARRAAVKAVAEAQHSGSLEMVRKIFTQEGEMNPCTSSAEQV